MTTATIICLAHVVSSCLSLSLLQQRPDSAEANETTGQNDFGTIQWGLVIDGKDAKNGPHAYGSEFDEVLESLDFVLHQTGNDDLTWQLLMDIHSHCCSKKHFRSYGWVPISDHGCECFDQMTSKDKDDVIRGIPNDFMVSFKPTCHLPSNKMSSEEIQAKLSQILEQYNKDAKMVPREDKKQQITAIAMFLRKLSWLHPFKDGNGRFRTLLLQRELRHRGVARGAFMYNNNRDVFFISTDTYAAKIEEGIKMASLALERKSNPWVNQSHVEAHFEQFPKKTCHDEGTAESIPRQWGSIDFDKK